jgi:hypothetical protein
MVSQLHDDGGVEFTEVGVTNTVANPVDKMLVTLYPVWPQGQRQ